jgi:hypothetical protein
LKKIAEHFLANSLRKTFRKCLSLFFIEIKEKKTATRRNRRRKMKPTVRIKYNCTIKK